MDTCAAEFEAATPYYYSTYETPITCRSAVATVATSSSLVVEDEIRLTDKPKVIILGGGPNRIGQGIEFDYCCVQAAFAMKELGYRVGDGQLQPRDRLAPTTTRATCSSSSR